MRWIRRIFSGLLTLVTLVVVGVYVALQLVDLEQIKQVVTEQVKKQTGRTLVIAGGIEPTLGYTPTVTLMDVSLSNPSWASHKELFQAQQLHISLQLIPLFRGDIRINRIEVSGATIHLESKGDQKSWGFKKDKKTPYAEDSADTPKTTSPDSIFTISKLVIRNTDIHYLANGKKHLFSVVHAALHDIEGNNIQNISLRGKYANASLIVDGSALNNTANITASIQGKNTSIKAEGRIAIADTAFDMNLDVEAGSIRDAMATFNLPSNDTTSLSLSANIGGRPELIAFSNLKTEYGNHQADGELNLNLARHVPYIDGKLHIPSITLSSDKKKSVPTPAPRHQKAIAQKADGVLPIDFLGLVSADLELTIDHITTSSLAFKEVNATVSAKGKNLTIKPFSATVADGTLGGSVILDATHTPPTLSTHILSNKIGVTILSEELTGSSRLSQGFISGKVALTGAGKTLDNIVATSSGNIDFYLSEAKYHVPTRAQNALQFFNLLGKEEILDVSCAVGQFDVKGGIASSKVLAFKTPAAVVSGDGDINMGQQSVGIALKVNNSSLGLSDIVPPLRVSGPFESLSVTPDPKGSLLSIGKLVLGASSGIGLVAVLGEQAADKLGITSDDNPCLNSIAQAQQDQKKNVSSKETVKKVETVVKEKREEVKKDIKSIEKSIQTIRDTKNLDGLKDVEKGVKELTDGFKGLLGQ